MSKREPDFNFNHNGNFLWGVMIVLLTILVVMASALPEGL